MLVLFGRSLVGAVVAKSRSIMLLHKAYSFSL